MWLQITLFFCCIFPHIFYVCKNAGLEIPEDGQIFYIRQLTSGEKKEPTNYWGKMVDGAFREELGDDEDQILKSRDHKFKWHDCDERTGTIEWKGDGTSSGFFITGFEIEFYRLPYRILHYGNISYPSASFLPFSRQLRSDPCTELPDDAKFSKKDILNPEWDSIWDFYDIYIPPVCYDLVSLGPQHCNCGTNPDSHEYWKRTAISTTNGQSEETSASLRSEIQAGIKATAKAGIPFIGETELEASFGFSAGFEFGSSFLLSSSTTKTKERTDRLIAETPSGKCTTFYQAIVYYGEFGVPEATFKKEKRAFCKRK